MAEKDRKDISISTVTVGTKKFYSFDVIDPKSGKPIKSFNTTDEKKAAKFYNEIKKEHPQATVNGQEPDKVDIKKELPSQGEYDIGGFEVGGGPDPWDPEPVDIQPELNNFDPEAGGDASIDSKGRGIQPPKPNNKLARDLSYMMWKNIKPWNELGSIERQIKGLTGLGGKIRVQPRIDRVTTPCELKSIMRGVDNNAFIVIGNDRVHGTLTGYGGKGHTQCDSIDIVAGMGGHQPKEVENQKPLEVGEKPKKTHPNFHVDAARIYLSQKTDVDKNFGLGRFRFPVEDPHDIGLHGAKSAIAIKADNIRVIGRESIHLVTMPDAATSQGGNVHGKAGVNLVALNEPEKLQPMVLGDNLQLAMLTVIDNIEAIAKIMHGYIKYQMKYNQALANHTHITHFYAREAFESKEAQIAGIQCDIETASKTEISVLKHITNLQGVKSSFLIESGDSFINSRYNKCN